MTWQQQLTQFRRDMSGFQDTIRSLRAGFDAGTITPEQETSLRAALDGIEAIEKNPQFIRCVEQQALSRRASGTLMRVAGASSLDAAGDPDTGRDDDDDERERRGALGRGPSQPGRQTRAGQPGGPYAKTSRNRPLDGRGNPDADHEYHDAFMQYLRSGWFGMSSDQQRTLSCRSSNEDGEVRTTQNTISGPDGAYLISPIMAPNLIQAQRSHFGAANLGAEVITTQTGVSMIWPNLDDTTREADVVGETQDDRTNRGKLAFGFTRIDTFKYATSGIVMTREGLEDINDLEGYVTTSLAHSLSLRAARDLIVGTGVGRPEGLVTALSRLGWTRNTATAQVLVADDLIQLLLGVGELYRGSPMSRYGLSSGTLHGAVRLLKGQGGEYLFTPEKTGIPSTIHGQPYSIASFIASLTGLTGQTTGTLCVTYGDHSVYKVRLVNDVVVRRFEQTAAAADIDGVEIKAFQRMGGAMVSGSTGVDSRPLTVLRIG